MMLRLALLSSFCFCVARAVLNGQELKRLATGVDVYGPPTGSALQYNASPQHIPHREYGVPQQISFQEYGPPALKYGPLKLNNFGGNSGKSTNGLYEQIKTHFGVPTPFYGPPHVHYKLASEYGRPQIASHYGPPQNVVSQHPPPLKIQNRPAPHYVSPPQNPKIFTPPVSSQLLPVAHPGKLFKPIHHPATSYGPPASGPLNLPARPDYETPPNYGPPPLPVNLPGPQAASFNRVPETTILLSSPGVQRLPSGPGGSPFNQVQIQIDASGHTHSVTGSQTPFHTACDGWKPISPPVGTYIEQNHIETQGGYSHVDQGQSIGTQYNVGGVNSGTIVDGLSDEQLVAVALQNEASNTVTGAGSDVLLNTIDSEALQVGDHTVNVIIK